MGAIGYVGAGGQENKVSMGICWYTGHGFGPYGRGNFPGHDVLGGSAKNVKDECRWTEIGVDGCGGTCGMGRTRKIPKKFEKFKKIAIFGNTGSLRQN